MQQPLTGQFPYAGWQWDGQDFPDMVPLSALVQIEGLRNQFSQPDFPVMDMRNMLLVSAAWNTSAAAAVTARLLTLLGVGT